MIPLSQYIEERIDALNQLDGQIVRMRDCAQRGDPDLVASRMKVIDDLQAARNLADRRLFELFALRSALWATPSVTVEAEEAWKELCGSWEKVIALGGDFASGASLRIGYLLNASNHDLP